MTGWLDIADDVARRALEQELQRPVTKMERLMLRVALEALVDHTVVVPLVTFEEVETA